MKRILLIVGIIVFFLVVLAAVVFKLPAPESEPEPIVTTTTVLPDSSRVTINQHSPTDFVTTFFEWYISAYGTEEFRLSEESRTELAKWFSAELGKWYYPIMDTTGNDPILLTDEDPRTWGDGIETTLVSQSTEKAVVRVTIGASKKHIYTVSLDREGDTWRIASSVPAD